MSMLQKSPSILSVVSSQVKNKSGVGQWQPISLQKKKDMQSLSHHLKEQRMEGQA